MPARSVQVDNNVQAAFAMSAQHLIQFVYAAAHSDDAGRQVVFISDGEPFTLLQVSDLTPLRFTFPLTLYTLPYWSDPPFLISDIRALWRSVLSARAPECQKLKMVGQSSMAKCKALTGK